MRTPTLDLETPPGFHFSSGFARWIGPAVLGLFLLGGCASVPKVEMDRAAATKVKRIAVLDVPAPIVSVVNEGGAAAGFGLIGAAIQGGMNAGNSDKFRAALASRGVVPSRIMSDALTRELRANGFEVIPLAGQAPVLNNDTGEADYSRVSTDADAILHVWYTGFGYFSPAHLPDYLPRVHARARLLEYPSRRPLYFKTFTTSETRVEGLVPVSVDAAARYPSFDALMGNVDQAVSALAKASAAMAEQVARDIKAP